MSRRYRGWLRLDHRAEHLEVELALDQGVLAMISDNECWEWPVSTVQARLFDGPEFELKLDGERVIFRAQDPIAFLFDFLPALQSEREQAQRRLRSWRRRRRPQPEHQKPFPPQPRNSHPSLDDRTTVHGRPLPAIGRRDVWTDVALGGAYSRFMEALNRRYRPAPAEHSRHDGHDADGGCSECTRIFIDLTEVSEEAR